LAKRLGRELLGGAIGVGDASYRIVYSRDQWMALRRVAFKAAAEQDCLEKVAEVN
jgi:hypothetical protein